VSGLGLPPHEAHFRLVENLVHEWARAIDEDRVEAIGELLAQDGRYTVQSRFNADRGLPLAVIDCHSAAQLRDRIRSLRMANIYEPHHYRHLVSGVQIVGQEPGGGLQVRANYLVTRTMQIDGTTALFSTGQYRDVVEITDGVACFRSRLVLFDSRAIDTLLAIPL
jgi:anthranilate 1,2-dioxygenase small subunit